MNPDDRPADCCFSGTGLSDQSEGLSPVNIEAYILNCDKFLLLLTKGYLQIFKAQYDIFLIYLHCTYLPAF